MEALIKKRIEEAAQEFDKECLRIVFENGANFILNNLWISVEEALPPRDESISYTATSVRVLVRIDFEGIIQHRTAVYDYSLKKWSMYDKGVTHWMNIPRLGGGEK